MPFTANDVSNYEYAMYSIWDGELIAHAYMGMMSSGHFSAALVFEHVDAPLETASYAPRGCKLYDAQVWIAAQLMERATGKELATGMHSDVEFVDYRGERLYPFHPEEPRVYMPIGSLVPGAVVPEREEPRLYKNPCGTLYSPR